MSHAIWALRAAAFLADGRDNKSDEWGRFVRRAARIDAVSALAGLRRSEHRVAPRASQADR
jgi:hypothetical protein